VVCDFTAPAYEQVGKDKGRVSGAKGRPPRYLQGLDHLADGTSELDLMLGGREAVAKGPTAPSHHPEDPPHVPEKTWRLPRRPASKSSAAGDHGRTRATQGQPRVVVKDRASTTEGALSLLGREIAPMSTGGVVG